MTPPTNKPTARISGEDGNIYAIIARASKALKSAGLKDEAAEMEMRIIDNEEPQNYDEAISIVLEYVKDETLSSPDLRVWWIPQVPGTPFHVPVSSPLEAKKILQTLGDYDLFQLEHNIKPPFSNAGGLEVLEDGDWTEWESEFGYNIDDVSEEDLS